MIGAPCLEELKELSVTVRMLGLARVYDVVMNDCGGCQMKDRAPPQDTYLCEVVVHQAPVLTVSTPNSVKWGLEHLQGTVTGALESCKKSFNVPGVTGWRAGTCFVFRVSPHNSGSGEGVVKVVA